MSTELKNPPVSLEEKTKSHPCYSGGCQNARIHLPVAPKCNISCNYCNRKFDCVNESRPGVTSEILSPEQALEKYLRVKEKLNNLKVVGIAGPGDALANFEEARRTFELIREVDPDITFCLSTNGLNLPKYARELGKLGVTHVTVTVNTIDPDIGARIYKTVNYEGVNYVGREAAEILLRNQLEGLKLLMEEGIVVKVNTVMIKGVNDAHIEELVKELKGYGVFIGNIMQLIPAPGSVFESMPLTTKQELNILRNACGKYLKQMYHCQQCRADAIGTLTQDCSAEFRTNLADEVSEGLVASKYVKAGNQAGYDAGRITIAVSTKDGRFVDSHFGQASKFGIYDFERRRISLREERSVAKFCSGQAECGDSEENLNEIINVINDCDIILTQRIGYLPQKILEGNGKRVVQTYGIIAEEIVKAAVDYQKVVPLKKEGQL